MKKTLLISCLGKQKSLEINTFAIRKSSLSRGSLIHRRLRKTELVIKRRTKYDKLRHAVFKNRITVIKEARQKPRQEKRPNWQVKGGKSGL